VRDRLSDVAGLIDKLMQHEHLVAAIVTAATSIILAIIAWISGAGKWLAGEVSKWLEHRRKMRPRLPRRTLHIVPEGGAFSPFLEDHDFGNGRRATRCGTNLLITNFWQSPVQPVSASVKLAGLSRFRCKTYMVHLVGPRAQYGEVVPALSTSTWNLSFYVLPQITAGTLKARIIIFDQLGNRNCTHLVSFVSPAFFNFPQ
jgi:hypothetical protein